MLIDALRLEFGNRNKSSQEKLTKAKIDLDSVKTKSRLLNEKVEVLTNEKAEMEQRLIRDIREEISTINPHFNVKEIRLVLNDVMMTSWLRHVFSSLSEAMSILKNSHKQTSNDTELRAELHKKDEELRKIQKNMTQWKVV